MDSSSRVLPFAILGLLLPLSACVTAPRSAAMNAPGAYRYCDPYALGSGAYGRCYNGISRLDYLGYGSYYGGYGDPQAYGPASALYGSYGFNGGHGGFGDYHFDDGYHFASAYGHGHPDFADVPLRYSSPAFFGSFGPGAGHYGSFGGLRDDISHHSGSPRHTSGIRHGGGVGHSRPGHSGSRHH